MEKQHLTYFKIENFKRFDSFEMENLGQFNLIVGDNNVGKTSVLEALTFDEKLAQWRSNMQGIVGFRGFFGANRIVPTDLKDSEMWSLIFKNIDKPIKVSISSSVNLEMGLSLIAYGKLNETEKEELKDILINPVPQLWLKQEIYNNSIQSKLVAAYSEDNAYYVPSAYMPFIPVNLSYNDDLVEFFYEYLNVDKELKKELEENLRVLIPNLEEIRVHRYSKNREILCVTLIDSNSLFPLVRFGEGAVKIARILLEIILARNSRLMIDEMGSGIHFTRLNDYWKTIIQLCAKYNVQLFATTHSLECQRAFVEALEDSEMQQYQNDARNITLLENKKGEVKAVTYDFEQFEYALNIGFNTRGGSR